MKNKYLLSITIFLSCAASNALSQVDSISLRKNSNLNGSEIFTKVTHPPYPTGDFKILVKNQEAIKEAMLTVNKNQDSVIVRFIVKKDGSICNPIFLDSISSVMKSAVIKLMDQSIPWQAGTNDGGRLLNVLVTMKLLFKYDQTNKGLTAKVSYMKPW